MGIGNRDYMRGGGRGFSLPGGTWGVTEALIAINVVVFIAAAFSEYDPVWGAHFTTSLDQLAAGRVWTILTSAFFHREVFHIFFNMFALFMFGRSLEKSWGPKTFLTVYLVGGVVGGLAHCLLGFLLGSSSAFGASACVMAIVIAFTLISPHSQLILIVIPMKAYVLATLVVGFDIIGLMARMVGMGFTNIAHGAHLGGALVGFLYISHTRGRISLPFLKAKRRRRSRSSSRGHTRGREFDAPAPLRPSRRDEQRMDQLLAKVAHGGLDSLSQEERDFMMDMSRKYRR